MCKRYRMQYRAGHLRSQRCVALRLCHRCKTLVHIMVLCLRQQKPAACAVQQLLQGCQRRGAHRRHLRLPRPGQQACTKRSSTCLQRFLNPSRCLSRLCHGHNSHAVPYLAPAWRPRECAAAAAAVLRQQQSHLVQRGGSGTPWPRPAHPAAAPTHALCNSGFRDSGVERYIRRLCQLAFCSGQRCRRQMSTAAARHASHTCALPCSRHAAAHADSSAHPGLAPASP
jgi:hypothetical protein